MCIRDRPGFIGVSAFAPPLDEAGNSVKAQSAIKFIMNKLGLGAVSYTHLDVYKRQVPLVYVNQRTFLVHTGRIMI